MHRAAWIVPVLFVLAMPAAAQGPSVVESWISPSLDRGAFRKLVVIGITDDDEIRRHFEDRFVSHLRGHGYEGVRSYELVPDLQNVEDRERVLNAVMEQRIDGAISIRVVPLDDLTEEQWAQAWTESMSHDSNLRMLIEQTLPVQPSKARRFGVEIAVWDTQNRYRVWAGRTAAWKRKKLREGAGDFIQFTLAEMKDAGLL